MDLNDENNIDNERLFAIKLADNDKKVRDECLSKITRYIKSRSSTPDGKKYFNVLDTVFSLC
jgi:hypothetical protein